MKKNHLQFVLEPNFHLSEMLHSLDWCIYKLEDFFIEYLFRFSFRNNCSLTQYCYLELLLNIHCQIPSNELTKNVNEYLNYLLKTGEKVTIGSEDLTRIIIRLMLRMENIQIQQKFFLFVEQTRTELSFIETLLQEKQFPLFENNIRQWIVDLLLTMDLFNEQLYTRVRIQTIVYLEKTSF